MHWSDEHVIFCNHLPATFNTSENFKSDIHSSKWLRDHPQVSPLISHNKFPYKLLSINNNSQQKIQHSYEVKKDWGMSLDNKDNSSPTIMSWRCLNNLPFTWHWRTSTSPKSSVVFWQWVSPWWLGSTTVPRLIIAWWTASAVISVTTALRLSVSFITVTITVFASTSSMNRQ